MTSDELAEFQYLKNEVASLRMEVATLRTEIQQRRWATEPYQPAVMPPLRPAYPAPDTGSPYGPPFIVTCQK